jgi:hypothetical protein
MRSKDFTTPRGVHGKIDLTVPGGGTSSLSGAGRVAREGEDARSDLGSRYRMLVDERAVCVYLGTELRREARRTCDRDCSGIYS